MKICPNCGHPSEGPASDCPECGAGQSLASASPPLTDSDRPVVLKAFPTELAAQAVAQALLAAGIPYLIAADNCGGAFPPLEIYRGIQVLVRTRDLDRARGILADFEAEKPEVDAETAEQAGAALSALAERGSRSTGWSTSQKSWLWFLSGLGLGIAVTTALLIDSDVGAPDSYTGVTEDDTDGDGRTDRWSHYRRGRLERDETDDNFDGKPDTWFFFEEGKIVRYEADSNFDGKIDMWTRYSEGRPDCTRADTDFNGRPDVTYRHSAGVTVSADWVDQDSGKLWKRVSYRDGYVQEELIDTDRNSTFDTKIAYDAFENPIQTVKLE